MAHRSQMKWWFVHVLLLFLWVWFVFYIFLGFFCRGWVRTEDALLIISLENSFSHLKNLQLKLWLQRGFFSFSHIVWHTYLSNLRGPGKASIPFSSVWQWKWCYMLKKTYVVTWRRISDFQEASITL